jgi:hypothetical protein
LFSWSGNYNSTCNTMKVSLSSHQKPTMGPTFSQLNRVYAIKPYSSNIQFNIILQFTPKSQKLSHPLRFSELYFLCIEICKRKFKMGREIMLHERDWG